MSVPLEVLRDEFATAALSGLVTYALAETWSAEDLAREAYRLADAMLAQRRAYCPACGKAIDPMKGFIVHESGCTYGWPSATTEDF